MQLKTTVICPYCGHENGYCAESEQGYRLLYCDCESGGCSGMFLVKHRVQTNVMVKAKRIEGEEKHVAERECCGCPLQPTKPTLTEDEEIFVRNAADYGVKYIARNADGYLFIYTKKPIRSGCAWIEVNDYCVHVDTRKYPFSFVKWEDAEPTYLPDLLGDNS